MDTLAELNAALLGRYEIEREIGVGGMAHVYLARDARHDRHVAIKVMKPQVGAMLGVERFLAEIKVTANLQHPNLLPLFDSGEVDGLLFYVMPYIQGESLRARIDRERQLPIDEAVRIAIAVSSAVDYAHRHGVIHRDLKPENILLHEGQPVVADFGIALAVQNAGGSRITATGLSLGTPQYMSPEQAAGDRDIDGRTDICSLGVMLYEMLTAEPPHSGPTAQAIIARVITEAPRGVRNTRPTVPEAVDLAVARALQKVPADRFATAREFAEALEQRHGVSRGATTITSSQATRRRARDPVVMGAVAVAALALGFAIWSATRTADRAPRSAVHLEIPVAPNQLLGSLSTRSIALAPDGGTVVFSTADSAGLEQLFSRSIQDVAVHRIPGTDGAASPAFSPDGKSLAFVAGNALQRIPLAGGTVTPLRASTGYALGITWGSAGSLLLSVGGTLIRVDENGGGKSEQLAAPDSAFEVWPMFFPDGKRALYGRRARVSASPGQAGSYTIAAIDVATGKRTAIANLEGSVPLGLIDDLLVYARPDGAILAVPFDLGGLRITGTPTVVVPSAQTDFGPGHVKAAVSTSGSLAYIPGSTPVRLQLIDREHRMTSIGAPDGVFSNPRYSPDGKRVAVSVQKDGHFDIWVYDLGSQAFRRLTTDGTLNQRPEWSPDGKRVIYRSDVGGDSRLWWQPWDGSAPAEQLAAVAGKPVWQGMLSSDGQTLVYRTGELTQTALWYRRLSGDTATRRLLGAATFDQTAPRFSPDGQWLVYQANASGAFQVYVTPFPGPGPVLQVSSTGGSTPIWSRDGHHVYYTTGRQIVDAELTDGPSRAVASRSVFYEGTFIVQTGHPDFDAAPDGHSMLILRPLSGDMPITLVHEWRTELRARR